LKGYIKVEIAADISVEILAPIRRRFGW